jgi:hypothetical protein
MKVQTGKEDFSQVVTTAVSMLTWLFTAVIGD